MNTDETLRERLGRKMARRAVSPRKVSLDIPERFRDGPDAQDDAAALNTQQARMMNQSVFSIAVAAGSQAEFKSRFDEESSEGEGSNDEADKQGTDPPSVTAAGEVSAATLVSWAAAQG